MKTRNYFVLGLVTLLTACSKTTTYPLKDYIKELKTEDFTKLNICCFNDLHISILTDMDRQIAYFEKTLKAKTGEYPDLLILNGDTFMDGNKKNVDIFFKWLEGTKIPFMFTYGNHDLEGQYSNHYIDKKIKQCSNSLLSNPINDDIYGDSNSVINIVQDGKTKWQLYFLDSNTYDGFVYDSLHKEQVDWYERQVNLATENNGGVTLPSLVFMHIPFEEFYEAWGEHDYKLSGNEDGSIWYMGEGVSSGEVKTELYEKMHELRSSVGIMCAHDHVDLTDWKYDKCAEGEASFPIRLIYGIKTGDGIYHDKRIMGTCFYTLNNDFTFNMEKWVVPYEGEAHLLTDDEVVALAEGK